MDNYFEKYKQAKLTLIELIKSNYCKYYLIENAIDSKLIYEEKDIIGKDKIDVYFHNYEPLATMTWNSLGIENSMITAYDLRNKEKEINQEQEIPNINYQTKYLKIYLLISKYVLEYYTYTENLNRATEAGIKYRDIDVEDGRLVLCDNWDQTGAGAKAFKILEINRNEVPVSAIYVKRDKAKEKLKKLENIKIK